MKTTLNIDWINACIEASKAASAKILSIYETDFPVEYKADESPVTIADKTSSTVILSHLKSTGIPIISEEEEAIPYSERAKSEFIWIVDPLDGTKEFIRKNDEFCICIALIQDHKPIFGLIASPTNEQIICGGEEMGSYQFSFNEVDPFNNKNKLSPLKNTEEITIAHSRSFLSKKTEQYIADLAQEDTQLIRKGSALKFFDLATGKATIYPRYAPTMEWDIAAGDAIYQGVGGCVLDFTNFEPLQYNKADLYNPFFIAKPKNLTL